MKKHVHLFEDYKENGTEEEIITLSIKELLVPERHLYSTMMDILNGGTQKTNDPILSIWITESGRNFLIDGHHRLFKMLLKGIKTIEARVIGSGSIEYEQPTNKEMIFNAQLKFGGLENFADAQTLEKLLLKT